jgi:G3E family GTPase
MSQKVPVTVLTGFLGSGKTTLLNRILTENHGQRIAVIENEFGEIGVDQDLVINADEEIFEMNNGCICCTVRGDLIRILGNLMKRRDKFDRIIVETTGMADPGPVAQTFFVDDDMRDEFALDGIVTLVDAKHVMLHIDDSDEVKAQIAFADTILLNKVDLVSEQQATAVEARIRSMNAMARIKRVQMANAPMETVLDIGGFDLDRALELKPTFLEPEYPFEWAGIFALPAGKTTLRLAEGPDASMSLMLLPVPGGGKQELSTAAERAFRVFARDAKTVLPGGALQPGEQHWQLQLEATGSKDFALDVPSAGYYALFTEHTPQEFDLRLLDASGAALQAAIANEYAAGHTHDDTVSSVGIEFEGAVDGDKINKWLSKLLQSKGADIFRMKGFLNIDGEDERFVFQGVHMLFDGRPAGKWGSDKRANRLVFIGRKLDRAALERGFRACAL